MPFPPAEKVPAIAWYVAERPAVWLDDVLTPEARTWAARRVVRTLLITIDPSRGLTRPIVDRVLRWVTR